MVGLKRDALSSKSLSPSNFLVYKKAFLLFHAWLYRVTTLQTNCAITPNKNEGQLMTTTSQFVLFGSNSSFWNNASLLSLVIDSNQLKKGVGTKKFLYFSFLRQEKICLMRYSRQALFPPSTRATLKSFGDVFAKSCYQCRSKRDGTLGIASAGFQVIRQHCKDSLLKEQRICLLLI